MDTMVSYTRFGGVVFFLYYSLVEIEHFVGRLMRISHSFFLWILFDGNQAKKLFRNATNFKKV